MYHHLTMTRHGPSLRIYDNEYQYQERHYKIFLRNELESFAFMRSNLTASLVRSLDGEKQEDTFT